MSGSLLDGANIAQTFCRLAAVHACYRQTTQRDDRRNSDDTGSERVPRPFRSSSKTVRTNNTIYNKLTLTERHPVYPTVSSNDFSKRTIELTE